VTFRGQGVVDVARTPRIRPAPPRKAIERLHGQTRRPAGAENARCRSKQRHDAVHHGAHARRPPQAS